MRDLTPEFQFNLARGLVYLQISSEDSPEGELRAQVSLNNDRCGSRPTTSPPLKPLARGSCLFEGRQYLIGETWRPDYDQTCTTCSCKVGNAVPSLAGPEFSIAEGYFFIIDICIPLLRTFLYHRHLYRIYNLYHGHLYITKNRHPLLVCKNTTSRFSGINFENVV